MSILRVVSVHGVSFEVIPQEKDYAQALEQNIVEHLKKLNVIPAQASQDIIDAIISFDRVNYSDIGASQRQQVYSDWHDEAAKLEDVVDKTLDKLIYDQLRKLLIFAGGNVLVYESQFWKNEIRQRVVSQVTPYIQSDGAISLIGHSLGSVVAFDVAYYNVWHNPDWRAHNFYPSNLFTFGSPIAVFQLDTQDENGAFKTRFNHPTNIQVVREGGAWYNFLDAEDVIAYPLEKLYPTLVNDFIVHTGLLPQAAHTKYWWNDEVAAKIAARLKLDYERVTGQKV